MRIEIGCNICSHDNSEENSSFVRYSRLCSVRDDGIYEFECPEGHRSTTVLLTPKHEVLFLIASNALLDGYLREAIASFAASLERFYEFVIRVICRSKSISQQDVEKCWKSVSKQSERQLGAFTILWFVEMGDPPDSLSNKMVELRNQVIHQGKVPSYEECIIFGKAVINVISPIERKMLDKFPDTHKDECFALSRSVRENHNQRLAMLSIDSPLSAAIQENTDLEISLEGLRLHRKILGMPSIASELMRATTVRHVPKEP
ncbi:hypothetical protein JOY44_19790 [Phormidium sp. CLA17]|uniref:hypothetical protein n=1 Tax=Leptolyngbya sp. Cla-17 TaxID=2803751 RepID=UPI0014925256|nr:hypothetical protein [Leptolyngbya sp. Cla-17]MBM0743833.1 hypothetical protein [Leptolyngbya sp. Cla-17]